MDNKSHPLRVLRSLAGLTQRQLANRVEPQDNFSEELTTQYIARAEKGLVGDDTNLSPIISALFTTLHERNRDEGRISIYDALEAVRGILAGQASKLEYGGNLSIDGRHDASFATVEGYIRDWRILLRTEVGTSLNPDSVALLERTVYDSFGSFRKAFAEAVGIRTSLYDFCRVLALHPFLIQRFEEDHRRGGIPTSGIQFPKDLRYALGVVGLDVGEIVIDTLSNHNPAKEKGNAL
jgi:hypothetical protein